MEIKLGHGIDTIQFGHTEAQAVSALGVPDKIFFTDSENKRLQFNQLLIELTFEIDNDNRLGWIEVYNKSAALFGYQLIGKPMAEVLSIIKTELDSEPSVDDYGSFISVTFEKEWLELQFKFNNLTNINFGVLYSDNDQPIWPTTPQGCI